MGLQRLSIFWLLIGVGLLTDAGGRSAAGQRNGRQSIPFRTPPQSNIVEFDLDYDISVPGETQVVSLIVLIPGTIPDRQKILSRKYRPKPSRIFTENGNDYAEFVLKEPERHEKVRIRIKAELYRYDLHSVKANDSQDTADDDQLEKFLAQERYLEWGDERILQIAEDIDGDTEYDMIKAIYDFVTDNLKYVVSGKEDKGSLVALELGKGDCTEYSDLFVAICRAKKIPTRVVSGYTVRTDVSKAKHNWAEVYMKNRGWVPIDPTAGDMANVKFRDMAFGRMSPIYIYFSHVRNDSVLKNHNYGTFNYWGDKVQLTDSIEFRFPDQPTADSR